MFESFLKPTITTQTVSGSICTFNTQYALPLYSHKVDIDSVSGVSAIVINSGSKNFMSNSPAETKSNNGIDVICDGHGIYTISGTATGGSSNITFVLDVPVIIRSGMYLHFNNNVANGNAVMTLQRKNNTGFSAPSITPVNRIYDLSGYAGEKLYSIRFYIANGTEFNATLKPMICFSSSAVDFVEYDGMGAEIQIGSTVYGGEYDARTGIIEVTSPSVQTIQLPPCPIDTLEGVNNIYADTGDTTLSYITIG